MTNDEIDTLQRRLDYCENYVRAARRAFNINLKSDAIIQLRQGAAVAQDIANTIASDIGEPHYVYDRRVVE